MSRNGSGTYNLPSGNPVVPSTVISSSWANSTLNDIAAALTQSLTNDGQTVAVANLPMGGFRHTTVGLATASNQYARADQVQLNTLLLLSTAAGTDDYTATMPLAVTTFTDGQVAYVKVSNTNTTMATLTINGGTTFPWVAPDGTAVTAGQIVAGIFYPIIWDSGTSSWRLLSSATANAASVAYVDAQIATRLPLTGGTLTGSLTLAGDPVTALQAATRQWVLAQIAAGTAGVSSFNARTGAVSLLSADVTGALGFTPYNATNPSAYISGITSGMIVTALGYAPYATSGGTVSGNILANAGVTTPWVDTVLAALTPSLGGVALDFHTGQVQSIAVPSGGITVHSVGNFSAGDEMTLIFTATNHSVAFDSQFKWPGGTQPNFNAESLKIVVMRIVNLDPTHYMCSADVY